MFLTSTFAWAIVNVQGAEYTNYIIRQDGTVEPDDSVITHVGNNYFLTQDINGTVTIQRDDAVFDGSGYTITGDSVKGTYDLNESVLYLQGGFNLTEAWNVTVQNVKVENCVNGISLVNAYYCSILNCSVTENAVDGIKIAFSSNNNVIWNNITSNADDAIQLFNAKNNNIMLNNMDPGAYSRVNGNGLQFSGNSSDNKIEGNNVTSFDTGVYIAVSVDDLSNNTISYNNFTNNQYNGASIGGTENVVTLNNFYDNGLISDGDNNCSGNYWNTTPSTYDESPADTPVDTNITPEFNEVPTTEPTPTPTPPPIPEMTPLPMFSALAIIASAIAIRKLRETKLKTHQ